MSVVRSSVLAHGKSVGGTPLFGFGSLRVSKFNEFYPFTFAHERIQIHFKLTKYTINRLFH
jgi:hypothetical protein